MNKITTIGNLTRDPEIREISGATCCNFTVASDTRNKGADGKPTTNFYSCTAWRGTGETIAKYMKKGDKIALSGDLIIRQYKDSNGVDRTAVTINVTDFAFLNNNRGGQTAQTASEAPAPAPARPAPAPFQSDDLPF